MALYLATALLNQHINA